MGTQYTPAYYSSFQDSISSLCKSILPFSKKRGLPSSSETEADARLSKEHSDYLKWQQESFHRILNLMGLHKEGILPESEVTHFKSQLLLTLTTAPSPHHQHHPPILRDKLLFLQELLYANCISDGEFQVAKRDLTQEKEEEWSVIDLNDDAQRLIEKKSKAPASSSAIKHIKGAAAVLGFGSSAQKQRQKQGSVFEETTERSNKKKRGLLGFINSGGDRKEMKKEEVGADASARSECLVGDDIKKELTRIKAELSSKNTTTLHFSNDEMESISTKLPTDKDDLNKFFPKSWCERHGEVVLDVVKKEFSGHVSRHVETNNSNTWPTFGDENENENYHPNVFSQQNASANPLLYNNSGRKNGKRVNGESKKMMNQSFSNPFWNS